MSARVDPGAERTRVKVWGLAVRLIHGGLILCVAVAWLTGTGLPRLHDAAGYGVLALVALRLVWGVLGPRADRFARFVAGRRATVAYARRVAGVRAPRYLGHNPLGGWMILALLTVALGTALSGALYTTDAFWGVAWMERLHSLLADALLALIGLHVAGVVFTSAAQGENLIAAMVHGFKPRTTRRHPESAIDG